MNRRPWPFSKRTLVGIAQLGPVGRLPAPGTWGSLAGLVWAVLVVAADLPGALAWSLLGAGLVAAVFFCGEAEVQLGKRDPGSVVLDEFAVMPVCFIGWDRLVISWPVWGVLLGGFVLFRIFDIAKPLGIARLQDLPGGWGVVADDLAAALVTCVVLHSSRYVLA